MKKTTMALGLWAAVMSASSAFADDQRLFPYPSDTTWMKNGVIAAPDVFSRDMQSKLDQGVLNDLRAASFMNGARGFSAATPVIFKLGGVGHLDDEYFRDNEHVKATNLSSGASIATRTRVHQIDEGGNGQTETYLEIYPRSKWPQGVQVKVELRDLTEGEDAIEITDEYTTTVFTVIDKVSSRLPMAGLVSEIDQSKVKVSKDHSVFIPGANELIQPVALVVSGKITARDFRTTSAMVDFREGQNVSKINEIAYRLALPHKNKRQGGVPVAIWVHDLGMDKKSAWLEAIETNARAGFATLSFDLPYHGERQIDASTRVREVDFNNLEYMDLGRFVGLPHQALLDLATVHRALTSNTVFTELNDLKTCLFRLPSWLFNSCLWESGEFDIDPSKVVVQGVGFGGMVGAAYGGMRADETDASGLKVGAGMFQNTGLGYMRWLTDSSYWSQRQPAGQFSRLIPTEVSSNKPERLLVRATLQSYLDYSDPVNFFDDYIANGNGRGARPLYLSMTKQDSIVKSDVSLAMAEAFKLASYPYQDSIDRKDVQTRYYQEHINAGLWFVEHEPISQFAANRIQRKSNFLRRPLPLSIDHHGNDSQDLGHLSFMHDGVKGQKVAFLQDYVVPAFNTEGQPQ